MRLVLLGAPGSGKGTQGARLADHFGITHVSSGDLMRQHVRDETELGIQLKAHLDAGSLVPDDVVFALLGEAVIAAAASGGYLLDGFPRTLPQAERAFELATPAGLAADAVIFLDVPDDVARRRLHDRASTSGRSDDSDDAVIDHRLQVFHDETMPLLDFYGSRGVLVTVPATDDPDGVAAAILAALDRHLPAA